MSEPTAVPSEEYEMQMHGNAKYKGIHQSLIAGIERAEKWRLSNDDLQKSQDRLEALISNEKMARAYLEQLYCMQHDDADMDRAVALFQHGLTVLSPAYPYIVNRYNQSREHPFQKAVAKMALHYARPVFPEDRAVVAAVPDYILQDARAFYFFTLLDEDMQSK